MRTKSLTTCSVLLLLVFLISCSKDDEHIVTTNLKQIVEISTGDLLIIDLGSFGDEEGASILTNPKNAKESKLDRQVNSNAIFYQYSPLDKFVGKDSVTLILNRGSNGSINSGIVDTTKILILVK